MSESEFIAGYVSPDAAEAAFYTAFAHCDLQAMDAVWANAEVICIHPGSSVIAGRDLVIRSWSHILTNAEPPILNIEVLSRTVHDNLAVHVVEERIRPAGSSPESTLTVLATNVYCLQTDGWRLLQHHASTPGPRQSTH
jgi:hypothetical protein